MIKSAKFWIFVGLIIVVAIIVRTQFRNLPEEPSVVLDVNNHFDIYKVNSKKFHTTLQSSYSYNGVNGREVGVLFIPEFNNPEDIVKSDFMTLFSRIKPGNHKDAYFYTSPCYQMTDCNASKIEVKFVTVKDYEYYKNNGLSFDEIPSFYERTIDISISWQASEKNNDTLIQEQTKEVDELKLAIWLLDSGKRGHLSQAKRALDRVILKDPDNNQAYVELARYHMKSTGGVLGFKRAEELLNAVLIKDENFANALVLRGYVHTHLGNIEKAMLDFRKAESQGTDNLWLETNWGQLHEIQKNIDKAEEYYNKAIRAERKSPFSNDRAKLAAYSYLTAIYKTQGHVEKVRELMEFKVKQFPKNGCFVSQLANFTLVEYLDIQKVKALAEQAMKLKCEEDPRSAKRVLADSLVVEWYLRERENKNGANLLIQAIGLDAEWPARIYRFASSKKLEPVLKKILNERAGINDTDAEGYTALAYAVIMNNHEVIPALIKHGANPNKTVNNGFSIFLQCLISSDKNTISAIIDSSKELETEFIGIGTAEDILKKRGFDSLIPKLKKQI
ncbi:hypothetical protein FLL45_04280 [Aliikangiella marina]|uniref:Tetratricopeptide repeat protein n=1 Tax=Aliikangiella marina TaxID=1712262 RepID=A0A545TJ14_9GAMM|nr:tetratricopeptide repeat protein [Aliikangiella marina]TQV77171.1 hypothetical protein FLL45_04280 [Aliikangiella marina]